MADNPELTPLPALAGVAGGTPVSSTGADGAAAAGESAGSSLSWLAHATAYASVASSASANGAESSSNGGHGAIAPYAAARCVDLSLYRIRVTHPVFLKAIEQLQKFVEFCSGNQTEIFFEGMKLLFSGTAEDRRMGNTGLVCAEVAGVRRLSCAEAYAEFSREAAACNLERMCSKWGCRTVLCYVLKPDTVRIATELVNLAKGNLGILKQMIGTTGAPRFCHVSDLGKSMQVQLRTGFTAKCSFCKVWPASPSSPDSPRASSTVSTHPGMLVGSDKPEPDNVPGATMSPQQQVLC